MRRRISTVCLSAVYSVGAAFAQSSQTITGTVTDAMCGGHHMMQGETPAQCTRVGPGLITFARMPRLANSAAGKEQPGR
jgi:hypothetical protein